MMWHELFKQMMKDVRNIFGQIAIYTCYAESEIGGKTFTTVSKKELDICIDDIGGLLTNLKG